MVGIQALSSRLASREPHPSDDTERDEHTVLANREMPDGENDRIDIECDHCATSHLKARSGTPARFLTTSVTDLKFVVRAANLILPSR
jgi:hypothetical protein